MLSNMGMQCSVVVTSLSWPENERLQWETTGAWGWNMASATRALRSQIWRGCGTEEDVRLADLAGISIFFLDLLVYDMTVSVGI